MEKVSFLESFREIEDPRIKGMVTYPLEEILFLVLSGVMCGFEEIEEMLMWGEENLEWLRKFLKYKNDLPTAKTIRKVLSHIDSESFKGCFEKWVASISTHLKGVVAIDGKTIKCSKKEQNGEGALHIVSAFAHEIGLVLGQEKVKDKSNEIKAIPELLNRIALEGTVVTIDAIGTQKEIANQVISSKADYLLALKRNQHSLFEDVELFFNDMDKAVMWDEFEETDFGHGRVEVRAAVSTSDIEWLKERHPDWKNLKSIVRIDSLRYNKKTKHETKECRYYISSLPSKASELLRYSRAHWSVENNLHWTLDVTFREDSCRIRKDYAGENLAIIRKIAFNLLKKSNVALPFKRRRTKALLDQTYRTSLIFS